MTCDERPEWLVTTEVACEKNVVVVCYCHEVKGIDSLHHVCLSYWCRISTDSRWRCLCEHVLVLQIPLLWVNSRNWWTISIHHGGQSPRCAMGHLLGFPVRVCWQCGKYVEFVDASHKSLAKWAHSHNVAIFLYMGMVRENNTYIQASKHRGDWSPCTCPDV